MTRWVSLITFALALAFVPAAANAGGPWSDNFDSYANGSGLHGQGGWRGWDGNPAFNGFVSSVRARSAPHSLESRPTTDIVQQYTNVNSGLWTISGWNYIPSGGSGIQYFILLNTYNEGGPNNWSLDMGFDQNSGQVIEDDPNTPPLQIIRDQWVPVRVEIDFNNDIQRVFYGVSLLVQKSWTEGASGGGALNLDALDIYSNAATAIYWDDLVLEEEGATSVEPTTWGSVKGAFRR